MVARGAWRVATLYIYGVRGVYPSQRRRGEGGAPNVGKRSLRRTRDGFNYQLCHAEMTIVTVSPSCHPPFTCAVIPKAIVVLH
eukprot:scaffold9668_cov35-Tisochrysis_lutea.AAC.11